MAEANKSASSAQAQDGQQRLDPASPLRAASLGGHRGSGAGFLGGGVFSNFLFGDDDSGSGNLVGDDDSDSSQSDDSSYTGPTGDASNNNDDGDGGDKGAKAEGSLEGGIETEYGDPGGLDTFALLDSPLSNDDAVTDGPGSLNDPYWGGEVDVTPGGPCDSQGVVDGSIQAYLSDLYSVMHPPLGLDPTTLFNIIYSIATLAAALAGLGVGASVTFFVIDLLNALAGGSVGKTAAQIYAMLNDSYWMIDDALRLQSIENYLSNGGVLDDGCADVYGRLKYGGSGGPA